MYLILKYLVAKALYEESGMHPEPCTKKSVTNLEQMAQHAVSPVIFQFVEGKNKITQNRGKKPISSQNAIRIHRGLGISKLLFLNAHFLLSLPS